MCYIHGRLVVPNLLTLVGKLSNGDAVSAVSRVWVKYPGILLDVLRTSRFLTATRLIFIFNLPAARDIESVVQTLGIAL